MFRRTDKSERENEPERGRSEDYDRAESRGGVATAEREPEGEHGRREDYDRSESRGGVARAERPRAAEYAHEEEFATTHEQSSGLGRGLLRLLALALAYVLALVMGVLGLRLGFLLMGANPANDFVDSIYNLSDPLAEPFQGISDNKTADSGIFAQDSAGIFEPATAIAMGVYLAIGILVIGLIMLLSSRGSTSSAAETHRGRRAAYEH
jgi:hypothetical protein